MTQAEEQARQLISEAEKKLSPKNFFQNIFTSYKNRTDEAIECYEKAGNLFKLSKNWLEASTSFRQAANLNIEQNNRYEAANNYVSAAKCLEKYDLHSAINSLLNAIQIYTDLGRFIMAAKLHYNIADLHEQNLELEKAIQHYEQAADYYQVEENSASAKKCLLKIAQYSSADFQDYTKAINIYEEIAFHELKNPITQYSARHNLLKGTLCHLCIDALNAKHALDLYVEKFPDFRNTREYRFLKEIVEEVEDGNEDGFSRAVQELDEIARLDTWHTKILLRIKNKMREQPDLL